MTTLGVLTSVSIAIMFLSTIFFMASEVAQFAMRAEIQNLLIVTLGLSVAFIVLSWVVARLNSPQTKSKRVRNKY